MKTTHYLTISALSASLASGVGAGIGCGGGGDTAGQGGSASTRSTSAGLTTSSGLGGSASTNAGGTGAGGEDLEFDAGSNDASLNPDSACATQSSSATLTKKPVDIIVLIDNSGSMTEEIVGVQKNINTNFATILEGSGLDYRVILVARHGKATVGQSICIEAPLSGIPAGGCGAPPVKPVNNPSKFYHYSVEIGSLDSWCKIISTFNAPDEHMLAPNGWSEWLRPEAYKVFIEITDDHASCGPYLDQNTVAGGTAAAAKFDTDLLALSPVHFADGAARNYRFYSIVAMAYNNPPTDPYEPTDPVLTTKCPTASNSGTGYQALSVLTDSLRFPLCDTTSYDVVFQAIAQGVIKGAKISCDFPIPEAPGGEKIDLASVVVQYTAGGVGNATNFVQVADAAACKPNGFYLSTDTIHLCTDTCAVVQGDEKAAINVLFACKGSIN
ncbi:MAG: hypothetical protein ACMG6S_01340 [Byssovorax sp.]